MECIEMIVPEHLLREALELVDRHKPGGYTVMRGLSGKGHRGVRLVSDAQAL